MENCNCTTPNGIENRQVSYLNQYTGMFSTPEGDIPISCVANSIREAAKILSYPGVFGDESKEPTVIKFVKGKIAVSAPIRKIGFNTVITPQGAIDSGAIATPAHADVENGTEVIFTATEPFGWKFEGWYKNGTLISKDKVCSLDVYDPFNSLLNFEARYVFDEAKTLRNGRYIEIAKGWLIDCQFTPYSNYKGRIIINNAQLGDYFFVINNITENEINFAFDPNIMQPEKIQGTATYEATAIGLNLIIKTISAENSLYLQPGSVVTMKWVNDLKGC